MTATSSLDAGRLVRGALRSDHETGSPRLDLTDRRLPFDTADTARIPAGIHLGFLSSGTRFTLHFTTDELHPMSPPSRRNAFTLWHDGAPVASVSVDADEGEEQVLTIQADIDPDGTQRRFDLYLPEALVGRVSRLEADGSLSPLGAEPIVFVYGDSIVQGWSSSDPGLAWPAVLGRAVGAEVCNLGFAGAARGEVAVAEQMAASDRVPAAVVLAFGTNAWTFPPTTAVAIAESLRIFLTTMRQAWPAARLVVVSPIVRPEADDTPNRLGATLRDLRHAIESAALENGDVTLIRGGDVMDADALVDGIHPGDRGQAALAAAVAGALGTVV